jgi:hypothetical protein
MLVSKFVLPLRKSGMLMKRLLAYTHSGYPLAVKRESRMMIRLICLKELVTLRVKYAQKQLKNYAQM